MVLTHYIIRVVFVLVCLIIATVVDLKTKKIPNKLTFSMMAIGLLYNLIFMPSNLLNVLIIVGICFLFALLPGIGMGDIKLLMGMGFFLPSLHIAIILGAASIFVVLVQFIKSPKMTFWMVYFRGLRPLTPRECEEKNEYNSVVFAPYILVATIILEGVTLACNYLN